MESPVPGRGFADLGVASHFIRRLEVRNIRRPTLIQEQVIPLLLAGKSLLFQSATGTGKTFAYLIPFFQSLLGGESALPPDSGLPGLPPVPGPFMCVCAPTHELCAQIKGEADFLLTGLPMRASLLIGSANPGRQIEGLKGKKPELVVGNPGRLLQLARMGKLPLGRVRYLVLDEGDRLTADEMLEDTRELAALMGAGRVGVSCSATLPARSRERLLPLLGGNAEVREITGREILREWIAHWALYSEGRRKIPTLRSFLAAAHPRKALVFTSRGGQVGNIVSQLQYHRIKAAGLYSDMDKKNRKRSLDDFRGDRIRVLVSSDLSARGLDIPGVTHVIALDVPAQGDAYIHRAGRTGRAGQRGIMVTIGDAPEMRRLAALEKRLGIVVYPKVLWEGRLCVPGQENLPD